MQATRYVLYPRMQPASILMASLQSSFAVFEERVSEVKWRDSVNIAKDVQVKLGACHSLATTQEGKFDEASRRAEEALEQLSDMCDPPLASV